MSHGPDEARLREILSDAVADVTPQDRLGEIRRRTSHASRPHRPWVLVVLGAGTATAAVVATGVLAGRVGLTEGDRADRTPAASPAPSDTQAAALYFVGATPAGARLFREFQGVPIAADDSALALDALQRLEADAGPDDPDYRTLWPDGAFTDVTVGDDWISVEVSAAALEPAADSGRADAVLGVQQAVYTAEAAAGSSLPIAFEHEDAPVRTILGVEVEQLVPRMPGLRAPVSISDPTEGLVADDALVARGTVGPVADRTPGEVSWELRGSDGAVVASGTAPVDERSWDTGAIDLSDLAPGRYVLSAQVTSDTDDLVAADTRTITVR
ncbi:MULTISPECIES: hypothetical protein [Nocardioides]|uniref:GerMN domain-containing protein n=1 Tax=Nocardioides vastitatis TaxID=2568655 RepID=A0ABW0ZNR9_9ACTN|nr:hypothetical protein [Nocardioides sp.]THJ04483.1 hypothetical protein E7Z54_08305 [Nocardioides sp.]